MRVGESLIELMVLSCILTATATCSHLIFSIESTKCLGCIYIAMQGGGTMRGGGVEDALALH